jgi:poly-gamma-glutamate biosynthesis protein PgsC/CapC
MTFETLFIGLIIAVIYVEIMDIYPGGIIVPAYVALYLDEPLRVLATIRYLILFGKRRFVMLVLLGGLWAQIWFIISPSFFVDPLGLRAIGWIIPGLLANNLEKQKIVTTLASMFIVAIITYFIVSLVGIIL